MATACDGMRVALLQETNNFLEIPMADTKTADTQADRIDLDNDQALSGWAKKFDATPEQIREAVQAVGDHADDVELHLKGSRSTSNSERVADQTK